VSGVRFGVSSDRVTPRAPTPTPGTLGDKDPSERRIAATEIQKKRLGFNEAGD